MSRPYFWLPISLLIALVPAGRASASEPFPGTIKTTLGLGSLPPCVLCHDTELGGSKTVNRPFGRKVVGYGLTGGDTGALAAILGAMRDAKEDSDGDGAGDIDEIKAGTDPNVNDITGEPPDDYPPPVYGCEAGGGHAGRTPRHTSWIAVALGAMGILLLRSRMRQPRAIRSHRKDG